MFEYFALSCNHLHSLDQKILFIRSLDHLHFFSCIHELMKLIFWYLFLLHQFFSETCDLFFDTCSHKCRIFFYSKIISFTSFFTSDSFQICSFFGRTTNNLHRFCWSSHHRGIINNPTDDSFSLNMDFQKHADEIFEMGLFTFNT